MRSLLHIRDRKTRVILGHFIFGAHGLGFDDAAALLLPTARRMAGFAIDVPGPIDETGKHASVSHGLLRLAVQHRMAGHCHHIFNARFCIQRRQQCGIGKAAAVTLPGRSTAARRFLQTRLPLDGAGRVWK
jgi:hypothetical protein